MTENENTEAGTVDLAELTSRLGLDAHAQQGVASFMGSSGPWTEEQAARMVSIWRSTDPETGVYTDPEAR
jgi:hypothetical protein